MYRNNKKTGFAARIRERGMGLTVELENQSLSQKLQTLNARADVSEEQLSKLTEERLDKLFGRTKAVYPH